MLESALEEIVLNAIDFTKSEKETLSEILDNKIKEQKNYDSTSTHYKRLAIQIEKLNKNIGRL